MLREALWDEGLDLEGIEWQYSFNVCKNGPVYMHWEAVGSAWHMGRIKLKHLKPEGQTIAMARQPTIWIANGIMVGSSGIHTQCVGWTGPRRVVVTTLLKTLGTGGNCFPQQLTDIAKQTVHSTDDIANTVSNDDWDENKTQSWTQTQNAADMQCERNASNPISRTE